MAPACKLLEKIECDQKLQPPACDYIGDAQCLHDQTNVHKRTLQQQVEQTQLVRAQASRLQELPVLLQEGPIKMVQGRLGHGQISLTLDTYSHLLPSMDREAADELDALLV